MIDYLGNTIRVAWPEHHIVWIEAALSLDRKEHGAAFRDIADLTGRSIHAVQMKAYALQKARLEASRTRRVVVPQRYIPKPYNRMEPSQIEPVSLARKMGSRA